MDSSCLTPRDEVSCGWNWMGLLLRILHHTVAHAILEQPPSGCCFLVAKSCLTLCDPLGYNPPGSSVHRIFQARILEWVAISFSRGSSRPRDRTWVFRITGRCFTLWATREAPMGISLSKLWEMVKDRKPDVLQPMGSVRCDWKTRRVKWWCFERKINNQQNQTNRKNEEMKALWGEG